jgi:transposase
MMGRMNGGTAKLFYEFSLEDVVPQDHLLRRMDRFIDFETLRTELRSFYSERGRPSVDPELMLRMLIIGYCYGIRSERRLCEEVKLNLAYRWYCRMGLEDPVPNHSTFSKNRHGRFREADLLRRLFEATVSRCMAEGLVRAEGFATDASFIRADVSRQRAVPGDVSVDWSDPSVASRAAQDYLDALDQAAYPAKSVSLTDPGSRWTAAMGGPAFFAWSTNYLVDIETSVIVDVEASVANRTAEVEATKMMIDRTQTRFGLKPKRLLGDSAYGSAETVHWLVENKKIAPHVTLWDKGERRDGTFSRSDFVFDAEKDEFTCPAGRKLRVHNREYKKPRSGVTKEGCRKYRARPRDCQLCPLKPQCTPRMPGRIVRRHIYEAARDEVRRIQNTEAYQQSRRDRKKVEMSFAHLKRNLGFTRLRLRGHGGARDEFLVAAAVQNLRKLARHAVPTVVQI